MRYEFGTELSAENQKRALATYAHRFTADHVPRWARKVAVERGGKKGYYPVQFASDADWLAHTTFPVKADGSLGCGDCCSSPTWPLGKGFKSVPFKKDQL